MCNSKASHKHETLPSTARRKGLLASHRAARIFLRIRRGVFSKLYCLAQSHLMKAFDPVTAPTLNERDLLFLSYPRFFHCFFDLFPSHHVYLVWLQVKRPETLQSAAFFDYGACPSNMPARLADGLGRRSVLRESHDAPHVLP